MEGNVVTQVFDVFTDIGDWIGSTIDTVSGIFYDPASGMTFVGLLTLIGVGIATCLMLISMVRSFLKLK